MAKPARCDFADNNSPADAGPAGVSAIRHTSVPCVSAVPVPEAGSFPTYPTVEEISEVNRAYLAKINEQQQEFMRRLSALNPSQT